MLLVTLGIILLSSCGSDDAANNDDDTNDTSGISEEILKMSDKLEEAALLSSSGSGFMKLLNSKSRAENASWTTTNIAAGMQLNCATTTSPKTYMQNVVSTECDSSTMYDLKNMIQIMCAVTNLVTVESGLPVVAASDDYTVTAEAATTCGLESEVVGYSFNATIEETTDSTYYDRKITVSMNDELAYILYYGLKTTNTYISFYNEHDPNGQSLHRGFYHYESGTDTMKFEIHTQNLTNNAVNFFRIMSDGSESPTEVKMIGSLRDKGAASDYVRWTYNGAVDSQDAISVGFKQSGVAAFETCVASDDLTSDGATSTCGDYQAPTINTFSTLMDSVVTEVLGLTATEFKNEVSETEFANFTWDDMESDVLATN